MVCICETCGTHDVMDVAVVGAGPAGLSAALYAGRAGLSVVLFGDPYSGQLARAGVVENFLSWNESPTGLEIVEKMVEHVSQQGVEFVEKQIKQIVKEGDRFSIVDSEGHTTCASTVILAAGTKYKKLGIEGEEEYYSRGVGYCTICDGPLYRGEKVAIVGFGNEAGHAALRMSEIASKVYLLGTKARLGMDTELRDQIDSTENLVVHEGIVPNRVVGDDNGVTGLVFANQGKETQVEVKAIFIEVGTLPSSAIASELGLELDGLFISVARDQSTNVPGFFAAGDITGGIARQAIVSAGDGARAAITAIDYLKKNGLSSKKLKTTQWGGSKPTTQQNDAEKAPKPSPLGEYISADPGFIQSFQRYKPNVEMVRKVNERLATAKLVVVSAHWCPDCRRNVPRMARIVENLPNWEVKVEDRDAKGVREKYNVRKIPTFILYDRDGKEVGRIIENPKSGSLEEDLLNISFTKAG